MEESLISVAVCTYNGEKHIEEQLQSILHQTYRNIEIIVVDDASTDKTVEKIKNLSASYPSIILIQNEENLGFNKNFEKAIKVCNGEFIAISDQDDIWKVDKLQILKDNIKDNWAIFSNSEFIDKKGKTLNKCLLNNFSWNKRSYKSILLYNFVTGHTCLLNRHILNYILPFPSKGFYDWWIGFVALYHNKLTYVDKVLTKHRIHDNSVMYKTDIDNIENEYIEVLQNMRNITTYSNLTKDDSDFVNNLIKAYQDCREQGKTTSLTKIIHKYYQEFFPDFKRRNWFSRLNFSRKYCKPLSKKKHYV